MTCRAVISLCILGGLAGGAYSASAQGKSDQDAKVEALVRNILKQGEPIATPMIAKPLSQSLSVTIKSSDIALDEPHRLSAILSRPNPQGITYPDIRLSQASLFVSDLGEDQHLALTIPADQKEASTLRVDVELRDMSGNLVTRILQPEPYTDQSAISVALEPVLQNKIPEDSLAPLDFDNLFVEIIQGDIQLPREAKLPPGAQLYIQLLENALAGGTTMTIAAENILPLRSDEAEIPFTLNRAIYEAGPQPDLAFKVWIADPAGRKRFVMARPVAYNGPEKHYDIQLDALKRGTETKRGRNLPPGLMAQTLIQGEASFEPINGVPGQARLKVTLRQDHGAYNRNPVLAEQTLLLRGIETRIPFSLTTDSTHFDPFAPPPVLSVALMDVTGRVYYESGAVPATEGRNNVRLFPAYERP